MHKQTPKKGARRGWQLSRGRPLYAWRKTTVDEIRQEYLQLAGANPEDCWLWPWAKSKRGYGYANFGLADKNTLAHRISYIVFRGPIPDGLLVCHKCDNRSCVNPIHLFLGTPKDNIQDAVRKGRMRFGERNGMAKLTERQALSVFSLHDDGLNHPEIAARLGVSSSLICRILSGNVWKHLSK